MFLLLSDPFRSGLVRLLSFCQDNDRERHLYIEFISFHTCFPFCPTHFVPFPSVCYHFVKIMIQKYTFTSLIEYMFFLLSDPFRSVPYFIISDIKIIIEKHTCK